MTKKILLINIDSVFPNIALKKIEKYYMDKSDEVIWNLPIFWDKVDKIYVSCVFTENKYKCKEWEGIAEIGGTGYDFELDEKGIPIQIRNTLLPPEIECQTPKINIGFTSRGCVRKCKFCFVPQKEGKFRITGDLYDIWDGKSKNVIFLDNNATSNKDHLIKICRQVQKENIACEFNQGLDIRLLDYDMAVELRKTRMTKFYFAWDDIKYEKQVIRGLKILKEAGINSIRLYVLCGFDSTYEQDLYRLNLLRTYLFKNEKEKIAIRPYVMLHDNCLDKPEYKKLKTWCEAPGIYYSCSFDEYDEKYNKKINPELEKLQGKLF